jgi:hypothetical protein
MNCPSSETQTSFSSSNVSCTIFTNRFFRAPGVSSSKHSTPALAHMPFTNPKPF